MTHKELNACNCSAKSAACALRSCAACKDQHPTSCLPCCPMLSTLPRLVVSTHLKNISKIGNLPQIGVKIKNRVQNMPPTTFYGNQKQKLKPKDTHFSLYQRIDMNCTFEALCSKTMRCFSIDTSLRNAGWQLGLLHHRSMNRTNYLTLPHWQVCSTV